MSDYISRVRPLGLVTVPFERGREKRVHLNPPNMAAIASQLRNYKEPGKEQLIHLFFALPNADGTPPDESHANLESLDINAVFSLGAPGQEDSYVSAVSLSPSPQSTQLTGGPISTGGKTISAPALPYFRLVGSQIRTV